MKKVANDHVGEISARRPKPMTNPAASENPADSAESMIQPEGINTVRRTAQARLVLNIIGIRGASRSGGERFLIGNASHFLRYHALRQAQERIR